MDSTAFPSAPAADETAEVSVLLVEDDAMVREWIESVLRGSEFRVAGIASTAAEGVELAADRNPQVVLTDYRLPDRAGTELVRARAQPARRPCRSRDDGERGARAQRARA